MADSDWPCVTDSDWPRQVHKLACNHRVTADMALTRLGSSDRAWVWSAMDYADEEPKAETFAVKFKVSYTRGNGGQGGRLPSPLVWVLWFCTNSAENFSVFQNRSLF